MPHLHRKSLLVTLSGVTLLALAALASGEDDFFSRAATQFRAKDYNQSIVLARKSAESPQREFLLGVAAVRLGRAEEAVSILKEVERKLPILGDYAALYQAEALLMLKKYTEAAAKAAAIPKQYPSSVLIRRSEKLYADIFIEAADYRGALKICQGFIEKYPAGGDSVDLLYQSARCREETGDKSGAAQIYRTIWLNNPAAQQAKKAHEKLVALEKAGVKIAACTAEELLRRASALYSRNEYTSSLQTLQSIPSEGLAPSVGNRIDLAVGMAYYRLRNYKAAEKNLAKAATSGIAGIRSEGRFWKGKALERLDQSERAYAIFTELAGEGKKQEFADDALMEAAGLRRSQGKNSEAARLFEQLTRTFPDSKLLSRAAWDAAWCHYLAGDHAVAAESFKATLKHDGLREKGLYWLARALEKNGSADAATYYRQLLDEYPAGFYTSWYREQKGIKDMREALGSRNALTELPILSGFEKPRLLASLGMLEEARNELMVARKKGGDKKGVFPGLARIHLEMDDYHSAITLFQQNRPVKWDKASLPLWSSGYPMAYTSAVARHCADNALSESLIYALIRAESGFSPSIKSHAGAIGLMQLMPATAKMTAREKEPFNPFNLTIPEYNLRLGTKHFRDLLKVYEGDIIYSVAAYNAGSGAVERWRKNLKGLQKDEFIESIPYQETRDYVKKVYASAATYRQLYGLR